MGCDWLLESIFRRQHVKVHQSVFILLHFLLYGSVIRLKNEKRKFECLFERCRRPWVRPLSMFMICYTAPVPLHRVERWDCSPIAPIVCGPCLPVGLPSLQLGLRVVSLWMILLLNWQIFGLYVVCLTDKGYEIFNCCFMANIFFRMLQNVNIRVNKCHNHKLILTHFCCLH